MKLITMKLLHKGKPSCMYTACNYNRVSPVSNFSAKNLWYFISSEAVLFKGFSTFFPCLVKFQNCLLKGGVLGWFGQGFIELHFMQICFS